MYLLVSFLLAMQQHKECPEMTIFSIYHKLELLHLASALYGMFPGSFCYKESKNIFLFLFLPQMHKIQWIRKIWLLKLVS